MAPDSAPGLAGVNDFGGARPSMQLLVLAGLGYALLLGWLSVHSRVFMDEVFVIEFGRIRLDPQSDYSMYMFADGSSLRWLVNAGPLLADWLFRAFESVAAFRLLNVLAMLVLVLAVRGLAATHGVRPGLAWLLALALLFDPSLAQSVVLGRPDALTLSVAIGGLWLADRGARRAGEQSVGWWQMAIGYGLCVCAISIWISATLIGPLIMTHWLANGIRLHRMGRPAFHLLVSLVLVPLVVLMVTVDLPHIWAVRQTHSADPVFPPWTAAADLWRVPELVAVSCFLVLPGVLAVPFLRPRWLIPVFATAYLPILLSGFYTFRIPYLLMYSVAAMALAISQTQAANSLRAWRRLLLAAIATSVLLLGVRVMFGFMNVPRPPPGDGFVAQLPAATRVADFSWDHYESGRLGGQHMMRTLPTIAERQVQRWLERVRPDMVIRAVDPRGTWILVEDLDAKLRVAGYCEVAWMDFQGHAWPRDRRVRPSPSPLLWRLGLYRDLGPYAIWTPCPAV